MLYDIWALRSQYGLSDIQITQMDDYLKEILAINQYINLTAIKDYNQGLLLHIEDSLTALPEVNGAIDGPLGDMGSGGGFPGVPLAIVTNRPTILIESRKKKNDAVMDAVRAAGCQSSIDTSSQRIEEEALIRRGYYAVLTARGLAQLSMLLELASPLLKKDGSLVCYKSQVSDDELTHAAQVAHLVGMQLDSDRSFLLSDNQTQRRLLVYKKIKQSSIKLPRKTGDAQNNPL